MKSAALGRHISEAEVTNISKHGCWLMRNCLFRSKTSPGSKTPLSRRSCEWNGRSPITSTGRILILISQSTLSEAQRTSRSSQRKHAQPSHQTDKRNSSAASPSIPASPIPTSINSRPLMSVKMASRPDENVAPCW
mgnify:CR=1 FL=1